MPFLTVIVNTYNRDDALGRCLAGLCEQEVDRDLYEIVIVNNNSTDRTAEVSKSYVDRYPHVRYVNEEQQGESFSKNRGCKEAQGTYLVYIDDDAIVSPDYLPRLLEVIKKHEPDIIGGPVYPLYTTPKPPWFRDEYETRKYEEQSGFSQRCRVTGANFVIQKKVLRRVGMFPPELGAKPHQMGFCTDAHVLDMYRDSTPGKQQKVYYALECYVRHHVHPERMKFGYLMRRSFYMARSSIQSRALRGRATGKEIFGSALWSFGATVWYFFRDVVTRGPRSVDFVNVCRRFCFLLGLLTEALSRTVKHGPFMKVPGCER